MLYDIVRTGVLEAVVWGGGEGTGSENYMLYFVPGPVCLAYLHYV